MGSVLSALSLRKRTSKVMETMLVEQMVWMQRMPLSKVVGKRWYTKTPTGGGMTYICLHSKLSPEQMSQSVPNSPVYVENWETEWRSKFWLMNSVVSIVTNNILHYCLFKKRIDERREMDWTSEYSKADVTYTPTQPNKALNENIREFGGCQASLIFSNINFAEYITELPSGKFEVVIKYTERCEELLIASAEDVMMTRVFDNGSDAILTLVLYLLYLKGLEAGIPGRLD